MMLNLRWGPAYKINTFPIYMVFQSSFLNNTINNKLQNFQGVTECSRQDCYIEISNFTIIVPVPNSGGVNFKITKCCGIWDGDPHIRLINPIYRIFQNSLLNYTVNIKFEALRRIIVCSRQNYHI